MAPPPPEPTLLLFPWYLQCFFAYFEPLFLLNSFLVLFSLCILSISSLASGDPWLSQVWQVLCHGSKIQDPRSGSKIQDSRFPGGLGPEALEPLYLGSWILGSKISGPRPGNLESWILDPQGVLLRVRDLKGRCFLPLARLEASMPVAFI